MPSIGVFTRAFAAITGTEFGSIMKLQRVLRDAGLLTTGARGVNAPDMVPLDAARMLIAVLVTDKPSLAPLAVSEFGRLPAGDRIMSEVPTPEGAVFSGLTDSMSLEETLAGVIEGTAAAPLEHHKLLSRNLKLSCNPTDLTADLSWCDGRSRFSAGGPWMMLLMDPEANAQRLDEIAAEQEDARIRARVFAGYGSRIKTVREVDGDLLMEVADLFRRAERGETRMAG